MDLYLVQIQGYFDIFFDYVYGLLVILDYLLSKNLFDIVVVFFDVGGVVRVRVFVKKLNDVFLVIIDKCC